MPLLGSEFKMPNLRPCRPATIPLLFEVSTPVSGLLPISFFTGTTGLFGGTGGGTPLPRAGFLLLEEAESVNGFLAVEVAVD